MAEFTNSGYFLLTESGRLKTPKNGVPAKNSEHSKTNNQLFP
jgi:hypothetical protein